MKKLSAVVLLIVAMLMFAASPDEETFDTSAVEKLYINDIKNLNASADSLLVAIQDKTSGSDKLIANYHECRNWYKRSEALTEYFYPNTARLLNGALIPEADDEEGTQNITLPEGLQVIEDIIYADSIGSTEREQLMIATWRFVSACRRLDQLSAKQPMLDWQIMEALKLEVVRVYALGITGFDTPASGKAIDDNQQCIEGLETYFGAISPSIESRDKQVSRDLSQSLKKTNKYLGAHPDFDSFDRMTFIRDCADPLYANIVRSCDALQISWPKIPSAINRSSRSIFQEDALDPWFYARDNREEMHRPEVAALGQLLFFDPVLSGDNQRACASCHRPELGFTDGNSTSVAFSGGGSLVRNSPTVLNAAFQASYFYDVRVSFLEDQIRQVVNNKNEFHGDFSLSIPLLKTSDEYRLLFTTAFRGTRDTAITSNAIVAAISAYERTLVSNNSRFDKHVRNEGNFMTKEELNGFNLFMGKAQCGTCHFLPMFNGTVPPFYTKTETEIIGVPLIGDTTQPAVDDDIGRLHTSGMNLHRFAFKTAGIRNIALTAPYMHNGVFKTLAEVVEFYNRGGAAGAGEYLPTQTLPGDRLNLTEKEKISLVKFMECLTDTTGLTDRPAKLPQFKDPELNTRKIGGVY